MANTVRLTGSRRGQQPLSRPQHRRKPRPVHAHENGEFPTANPAPGGKSTWIRHDSICAIRSSTASAAPITTTLATNGIHPMYDYTHCISDAISASRIPLCTLEFEPIAVWPGVGHIPAPHAATRPLIRVFTAWSFCTPPLPPNGNWISWLWKTMFPGWDDPRMPTILACADAATSKRLRLFIKRAAKDFQIWKHRRYERWKARFAKMLGGSAPRLMVWCWTRSKWPWPIFETGRTQSCRAASPSEPRGNGRAQVPISQTI